eukprot:TRINITY_DN6213_c0_g1_i2.p1 TRINITY_DN6213_c0_g1~~TRINITY_DN6213_c0_g1_i2.p1  ORF type:complete len:460 (-),score=118.87 TRINITY_DN6213_c0_g1_i2:544-1923(-)
MSEDPGPSRSRALPHLSSPSPILPPISQMLLHSYTMPSLPLLPTHPPFTPASKPITQTHEAISQKVDGSIAPENHESRRGDHPHSLHPARSLYAAASRETSTTISSDAIELAAHASKFSAEESIRDSIVNAKTMSEIVAEKQEASESSKSPPATTQSCPAVLEKPAKSEPDFTSNIAAQAQAFMDMQEQMQKEADKQMLLLHEQRYHMQMQHFQNLHQMQLQMQMQMQMQQIQQMQQMQLQYQAQMRDHAKATAQQGTEQPLQHPIPPIHPMQQMFYSFHPTALPIVQHPADSKMLALGASSSARPGPESFSVDHGSSHGAASCPAANESSSSARPADSSSPQARQKKQPKRKTKSYTPINPYIAFTIVKRTKVRQEHPYATNQQILQILGEMWRKEPPSERQRYSNLAEDLNHERGFTEYRIHPDQQHHIGGFFVPKTASLENRGKLGGSDGNPGDGA